MSSSQAPLSQRSSSIHQATAGPLPGLVVTQGIQAGTVYYLLSDIIAIGRTPDNDVCLDDRGIAPHHACIRRQRAGNAELFRIYDLGSGAGVQVNGAVICLRHPLVPRDRITIGGAVLEFFTPTR